MDPVDEDLSARILLRNVLHTELSRTPITRSASQNQPSVFRSSSRLRRSDVGALTPTDALRRKMKQKLHESTSRTSLPPSKRRTVSTVVRKSTPASAPLQYDDDITPRHLLKGILQTEPETSLLVQARPIRKEPALPPADSSLNSNSPSTGMSGLDLSDMSTVNLGDTTKGLSRKRPRRSLNITAFERQLEHGKDVDKELGDSAEDLSALSSNSATLSLKTPFVDARTERRGLQRKVANRRKINVEDFEAAVQNRRREGDPELSDLTEPDITKDIINSITELYANSVVVGDASSLTLDKDPFTAKETELEEEMEVEEEGMLSGVAGQGEGSVRPVESQSQMEENKMLESQAEDDEVAESQPEEEEVAESQSEEEEVAKSQTDKEGLAESQPEEEEVAESQSEEEEVAKSQTDKEGVAESQIEEELVAETQSDEEEVLESQTEKEVAETQSEEEEEVAETQTEEEEVAESQSDEEEVLESQTEKEVAETQSEEEEEVAESQSDEEEILESQTEKEVAETQSEEEEEVAEIQTEEEEVAESQTEEEEEVAKSQTEEQVAESQTEEKEEEVAEEQVAGSQTEEEEEEEEAVKSQTEEEEEEEEVVKSQTEEEQVAGSQTEEDEEEVAKSQTEEQVAGSQTEEEEEEEEEVAKSQTEEEVAESQTEEDDEVAESETDDEVVADSQEDEEQDGYMSQELSMTMPIRLTDAGFTGRRSEGDTAREWHSGPDAPGSDRSLSHTFTQAGAPPSLSPQTNEPGLEGSGKADASYSHAVEEDSMPLLEASVEPENAAHHSSTSPPHPTAAQSLAQQEEEWVEEEEEEEDEDGNQSEEPSMTTTPAFVRERRRALPINPLVKQTVLKETQASASPGTAAVVKPKKVKPKRAASARKELPKSYVMSGFKHFAKTKVSADVYPVLKEIMNHYFDRMADDLEAYAAHANRRSIKVEDVELLLRRQGFATDTMPVNVLIEKYLPMEYRRLLIPCATSGNYVIPKQRK